MPPKLLSAKVLLCERVLHETDNVASLIRLVDLFVVSPQASQEFGAALMYVVVICSFEHDDTAEHSLYLTLRRPDGSEKQIAFAEDTTRFKPGAKIAGLPKGFIFSAPWGVIATHMGLHEVKLSIDGEYVGSSIFTLTLPTVSLESE